MNTAQWRDEGENSRFPFSEFSGAMDSSGRPLPQGFLCDARILASPLFPPPVYLRRLTAVGQRVEGIVSSAAGDLGTFSAETQGLGGSQARVVGPMGDAGVVVFGLRAEELLPQVEGLGDFAPGSLEFEASCVAVLPDAVYGLKIGGAVYQGKIALLEGPGIYLQIDGQRLRVDAVGERDEAGCCLAAGKPIRSISGVSANRQGALFIALSAYSEPQTSSDLRQMLRIDPVANGLRFSLA